MHDFLDQSKNPPKKIRIALYQQLLDLYEEYRAFQKNASRIGYVFRERENKYVDKLNNLFDLAHANTTE